MQICGSCGKENEDELHFCKHCGYKLKQSDEKSDVINIPDQTEILGYVALGVSVLSVLTMFRVFSVIAGIAGLVLSVMCARKDKTTIVKAAMTVSIISLSVNVVFFAIFYGLAAFMYSSVRELMKEAKVGLFELIRSLIES